MTPKKPSFHLRRSSERGTDFIYTSPLTGNPAPGDTLDEPSWLTPLALPREQALKLMFELNRTQAPPLWELRLAPEPCPRCGQEMMANDPDFCYPENPEYDSYGAGCWVHNLGCGFECTGPSYEAAIQRWNTTQLFNYPNESFVRAERLGKEGLRPFLLDELTRRGQSADPAPQALAELVAQLCADPAHRLHYVARVFRDLLVRWPDRNQTR